MSRASVPLAGFQVTLIGRFWVTPEGLERRHVSAGKPRWGWVLVGKGPENHITYDAIKSRHDRLLKKLALKRFRLYDMRHTFLTRLGESGADAFTIQKMAGHSSIMVSARYVHPTPERVEDGISPLEQYNQRKAKAALASASSQAG